MQGNEMLGETPMTGDTTAVDATQGNDIYLFISFSYHIGYNIPKWDTIWYDFISVAILG